MSERQTALTLRDTARWAEAPPHAAAILSLVFDATGQRLVSVARGAGSSEWRLWSVESAWTLAHGPHDVRAILPGGARAVVRDGLGLAVLSLEKGEHVWALSEVPAHAIVSADAETILAWADGWLSAWDVESGTRRFRAAVEETLATRREPRFVRRLGADAAVLVDPLGVVHRVDLREGRVTARAETRSESPRFAEVQAERVVVVGARGGVAVLGARDLALEASHAALLRGADHVVPMGDGSRAVAIVDELVLLDLVAGTKLRALGEIRASRDLVNGLASVPGHASLVVACVTRAHTGWLDFVDIETGRTVARKRIGGVVCATGAGGLVAIATGEGGRSVRVIRVR